MLKIKSQTAYYVTETCFELPTNLADIDTLLRRTKSTGEVIGMYNSGGVLGISIKQRVRVPQVNDKKVREVLGIADTTI